MTTSERDVVAALGRAIAQRIGEPRYNFWFDRNTVFSWDDDILEVGVPNHFFQEWLQKTFAEAVRAAAAEVLGGPKQLRFTINPVLFQAARRTQQTTPVVSETDRLVSVMVDEPVALPSRPTEARRAARPAAPRPGRSRRWHRLGDFVVGACNRLAHAAALAVVESPHEGPGPLVLHGPVGTGKTHLLEGIYGGLRRANPGWRVCYVGAEEFTNRFVQAMRLGKLGSFRKHFRECDALLVDDLHFLAAKRATQEEFLHTFDALQAQGRPVVLSCDCHPRLVADFTPEVVDRLLAGGSWPLHTPDPQTRLEILQLNALRQRILLSEDVLRFLASQLRGNVRELEGSLHSLKHYSRVTGRPVDVALARDALSELLRHSVRVLRLEDVDRAVCRALLFEEGALQVRQRTWAVSHPRMLAIYLARKYTPAAYSEIGRYFGGRNHSTAVAAEKKVRLWLQDGAEMLLGERRLGVREAVELVERELLG